MNLLDFLKQNKSISTPAYFFDEQEFLNRIKWITDTLKDIPLTYSIKSNPFLLPLTPNTIKHVEVCSPGELSICKNYKIPGEKIIYSGVCKEYSDIKEALSYKVDIATAESMLHVELEQEIAKELGIVQKVILRPTSGNQFGMSENEIRKIISNRNSYPNLNFCGLHYYSGTQKKNRQIERDLSNLKNLLNILKEESNYSPELVEYGPGLMVDYFSDNNENEDKKALEEALPLLANFAKEYPLGVEMGRFISSSCGTYISTVKDIKTSFDTNYLIMDGGIHHLNYFGQNMAMKIPCLSIFDKKTDTNVNYCVCGSLCTTADILIRDVVLPELKIGSKIAFHKCGAYSVTEASYLFLSRNMPRIYIYKKSGDLQMVRDYIQTSKINSYV